MSNQRERGTVFPLQRTVEESAESQKHEGSRSAWGARRNGMSERYGARGKGMERDTAYRDKWGYTLIELVTALSVSVMIGTFLAGFLFQQQVSTAGRALQPRL